VCEREREIVLQLVSHIQKHICYDPIRKNLRKFDMTRSLASIKVINNKNLIRILKKYLEEDR